MQIAVAIILNKKSLVALIGSALYNGTEKILVWKHYLPEGCAMLSFNLVRPTQMPGRLDELHVQVN